MTSYSLDRNHSLVLTGKCVELYLFGNLKKTAVASLASLKKAKAAHCILNSGDVAVDAKLNSNQWNG